MSQLRICNACQAVFAPEDMLVRDRVPHDQVCPKCGTNAWSPVQATVMEQLRAVPPVVGDTSFREEGREPERVVFEPSWAEFHRDCLELADKVRTAPIKTVLAVARGGLVPATILAHALGIVDVRFCAFTSYSVDGKRGSVVSSGMPIDPGIRCCDGAYTLVVDDLVDSGATLGQLSFLRQAIFVAPYAKPAGIHLLHAYTRQVAQKIWIKFPWEET